ncbi:hypothetical protein ACFVYD_05870 [Streptomyces sp. NPDC058301]
MNERRGPALRFLPKAAEFPRPHAHGYTDFTPDGEVADATD